MAYTITRAELIARALRKTDTESDANVTEDTLPLEDECNDLISQAWKIVFGCDPDRLATSSPISVVSGTSSYALPADFMSLRRVDDDQGFPLEPAPNLELDREQTSSSRSPRYRLIGGGQTGSSERIELRPTPNVTATFTLYYVATAPVLTDDTDELDCRFDEHVFITNGLAAFIAERQQRDSTPYRALQLQARRDIEAMARKRDSGRAPQITDVRTQQLDYRARYPRP